MLKSKERYNLDCVNDIKVGSKYTISEKIKQEQWRQHLISDEEFFNKEEFRTKSEREAGTSQKA